MKFAMPDFAGNSRATELKKSQRSSMLEYDQPLVWVTLLLLLAGVVMVYSASIGLPDAPKYANYQNHHFLLRQSMFVCCGGLPEIFHRHHRGLGSGGLLKNASVCPISSLVQFIYLAFVIRQCRD